MVNPKFEALSSLEVLDKIKKYEEEGKFSEHIDTINPDYSYVGADYPYIPDAELAKKYKKIERKYIKPYMWLLHHFILKTKVYGKENLKGIDSAILTCNHVLKADCLVVRQAVKPHKLYTIGASFNNQNGLVGDWLKAGGMLPLANDYQGMKKFNEALEYYINRKNYILFFPETAEWWCYEKPRPYANGAFHYAVKFNVPVIPCFITFKNRRFAKDEFGLPKKKVSIHIMPPIYMNKELSKVDAIEDMKQRNFSLCKAKYEEIYKRKLTYSTKV